MEIFVRQTPTQLTVGESLILFWLSGLIFAIAGLFLALFNFSVTTLTCQRHLATQGRCELVKLGLHAPQSQEFPLDTLHQAIVRASTAGRGTSYELSLLTSLGEIDFAKTSFKGQKYAIASQINEFIENPNKSSLEVKQDPRLSGLLWGLAFWVAGLVFLLFMGNYFEILTCEFDRNRGLIILKQRNLLRHGVLETPLKEIDSAAIESEKHTKVNRLNQTITFNRYRIVLALKSGERFLLTWYDTEILQSKQKIIQYINKWIRYFNELEEKEKTKFSLKSKQSTPQQALEQEISMWRSAIGISPNNAEAHYHLGLALYRHHQRPEAIQNLQRARQLFQEEGNIQKAMEVQDFLWQSGLE
jgi:tetratricopeptide (TPR) repeat protein